MGLRQRIDGLRFAPQLFEQIAEQQKTISELRSSKRRKPRGVVVTTMAGQDEYTDGDSWDIATWYNAEESWLHVHNVSGERIASYAPKTFARIEHGSIETISEKAEEATA